MKRLQKLIALVMAAVMLLTLAGCFASAEPGASAKSDVGTDALVDTPMPQPTDPARIIKSSSEWNKSRTIVVAEVLEMSVGKFEQCIEAEGSSDYQKTMTCQIRCNAMWFYNYHRLREAADRDGSNYLYFRINGFGWLGGKSVVEYLDSLGIPDLFYGDITEEFLENLKRNGQTLTYDFYIDWEYRDQICVGDVVLMEADPQKTINPNYWVNEPPVYLAMFAPFAADHPQPHIAKFVDGKLVLPAELSGAFELSRLYDDTKPQLTGIKDGDSVEDVVAFLRAVEQDMARYEAENTTEPAGEPISSGTESVDPEVDEPEIVEPEPSEPVVQESNEGLQSAVGGTFGWYSTAYSDRVYYADHSGNIMFIDAGTNTRNVLEGAALSGDEILLRDANGDCLLSMSFSMKEGFVINRMELDGSGKREIIRLPDHVLTYINKDFIFTKGSKLYIQLKNTKVKSENDVYELMEIDVDAETARTLYTFESGQSVIGGYGNSLFLRTDLGRIPEAGQERPFEPSIRYRYDAYDVETGDLTTVLEADLPAVYRCSGRSVLSMTWEEDRFVSHIYDLATGEDKQTVVGVVPDAIRDRLNTCLKNSIAGEALDRTHFTFECPDFETSQSYCCIVDAENGVIALLDDIFADSEVKLPYGSAVFAETEDVFYFVPVMGGNPVCIYAVPRQQLLDGHVTDVTIVQ